MARRLPVVIAQSPVSNPQRRDLEEAIVGALLMERGMDLNVIPHLEDLEPGETGLLCLEGITGPMALAAWMAAEPAQKLLQSHGIQGRRGRSEFDRSQAEGPPRERPIYFLDLNGCHDAPALIAELRRIRDDLATPTVALGLGLASSAGPSTAATTPAVQPELSELPPVPAIRPPAAPANPVMPAAAVPARPIPAPADFVPPPAALEEDDESLDRLLDQFDELDL